MRVSLADGTAAVKLARKAIEVYLENGMIIKDRLSGIFERKMGVFTTLLKNNNLRGCIGFPYPIKRLDEAIIESAIAAATEDPRFPKVSLDEMNEICVEVTILTPPTKLEVAKKDLPKLIKIGVHGILVKSGLYSGLLLPQVAIEYNFDPEEFLSQTCMKAGLPPDCWLFDETEVYVFSGQIFKEINPKEKIIEVLLEK